MASSSGEFHATQPTPGAGSGASRRATVYGGARQPKSRAIAAVLGGDLYERTRREGTARLKGDVDIELLLHGAERLAAVYPIAGVGDKITQLRARHRQLTANITHYEAHVNQQSRELEQLNMPADHADENQTNAERDVVDELLDDEQRDGPSLQSSTISKADLEREEAEIEELERKKKMLEVRVSAMERDLEGLSR